MFTERMSQAMPLLATIDPASRTAGTTSSDYCDLSLVRRLYVVLLVGDNQGSVTWTVRESQDTSGTGEQALITGSILGGTQDNVQDIIEVKAEQLSAGYRHVRAQVVIGGGTVLYGLVALGGSPHYHSARAKNLASVYAVTYS